MLEFANPNWLWGLLLIPLFIAYELSYKKKQRVRLFHPQIELLKKVTPFHSIWSYIPLLLRLLAISFILISLGRPQLTHHRQEVKGKGIDIILTLDVSGSMRALDFHPVNRLEAAKKIANQFIDQRINDRLGIVIFAGHAFTKCPLTMDYSMLKTIMSSIDFYDEAPGTAIGMGLATSVARLKDSDADSKVVILLTDGDNNAGEISPEMAAELAKVYDIRVYPIGIGSHGPVDFPFQTPQGIRYRKVDIGYDMNTLHHIAEVTGTQFAREATNTEELAKIFDEISQLEKAEFFIENYYEHQDLFWFFLLAGFCILFFEFILKNLLWKELP